MKIAVIALCALISGCATQTPIYTQDGRQGVLLTCSGWARDWGECMTAAGDRCGTRGYDVIDRHEETVEIGVYHQPKPIRQMTIVCRQ